MRERARPVYSFWQAPLSKPRSQGETAQSQSPRKIEDRTAPSTPFPGTRGLSPFPLEKHNTRSSFMDIRQIFQLKLLLYPFLNKI